MSSSASTPGSGERVALDTSVAIDVLAATADARLLTSVSDHLLPAPVVGELRYGALNSRKALENLAKVDALVTRCVVLNVTVATAEVYVEHQVPLAASDAHFDAIDDLQRWPSAARRSEPDVPG